MHHSDSLSTCKDIELIIFDCDGVLVDSEILSERLLLKMLKEVGADVSSDYFYNHFLGYNFEHVTARVLEDFAVVLTSSFREAYRKNLLQSFNAELETTCDISTLLKQLTVKTCVATSGSPDKVKNSLKCTKLNHYFEGHVFTSSEVANGKPAPDLFLFAAKQMGVNPENCLVIEDSPTGIKAALAAKMQVVRYIGASHLKDKNITTDSRSEVSTINHWSQFINKYSSLVHN